MNNLVGVHCHNCNKNTDAKETAPFISLPSTLIVCVRRFAYNQRTKQARKLNDKLEVSSKLTIETTMVCLVGMLVFLLVCVQNITKSYQLYSVVIHRGTPNSGNYFTYGDVGKDSWYCFNDESVSVNE